MKKFNSWLLWLGLIAALLPPPAVPEETAMSDARKKALVYEMYSDYKQRFPAVKDIHPLAAMELLENKKVVFVDTRTPEEMDVSMLPASISEAEYLKNPETYRGKTVVGYCTISFRSGFFAEKMASRGLPIYNLTGGLLAWVLEGGKVYSDGREIKRIHVYGDKWDYAPQGYETVKFGRWRQLFSRK